MRGTSDPRFRGDDRERDGGVNPALRQPRSRRAITCAWIRRAAEGSVHRTLPEIG